MQLLSCLLTLILCLESEHISVLLLLQIKKFFPRIYQNVSWCLVFSSVQCSVCSDRWFWLGDVAIRSLMGLPWEVGHSDKVLPHTKIHTETNTSKKINTNTRPHRAWDCLGRWDTTLLPHTKISKGCSTYTKTHTNTGPSREEIPWDSLEDTLVIAFRTR